MAISFWISLAISTYKNGQLNISELVSVCDLSRTTVYIYIDLLEV